MVAPLVVAARTSAGVESREAAEKKAMSARSINRTSEQNQNRVLRAKEMRRTGSVTPLARAANDNYQTAANDNEKVNEQEDVRQAQARVKRLRFLRAQVILAPEAETESQIAKEEKQKPSLLRYSPALVVGGFKDSLDWIGIGSLPGIGWIVTFICSVLIFIFLLFAKKRNSMSDFKFVIKRLLVVLVAFVVEAFALGVNVIFPFEVIAVTIVYFMDKKLSTTQIAFLQNIAGGLRRKPL